MVSDAWLVSAFTSSLSKRWSCRWHAMVRNPATPAWRRHFNTRQTHAEHNGLASWNKSWGSKWLHPQHRWRQMPDCKSHVDTQEKQLTAKRQQHDDQQLSRLSIRRQQTGCRNRKMCWDSTTGKEDAAAKTVTTRNSKQRMLAATLAMTAREMDWSRCAPLTWAPSRS